MKKFIFLFLLIPSISFSNYKLTLQFSGMVPHIGNSFFIRVIDKSSMLEVGRTNIQILEANFNIDLYVLIPDSSYYVDFYADFNANGMYDSPPVDHAWRIDTGKVNGDTSISFAHNTNFTDIQFPAPLSIVDLVGNWNGKWDNPTFSVEGQVAGQFSFDSNNQTLTAQWQSWGLFGNPDPMSFSMVGSPSSDPWNVTFTAQPPWNGQIILNDGQISGEITYAAQGITATVLGNYGERQLIAYYNMITINAEEYTVINRDVETSEVVQIDDKTLPEEYFLYDNFPNPFNPTTEIRFDITKPGFVVLKIFSLSGKEIYTLVDQNLSSGSYKYAFHADKLPSGVYFFKLSVNGFTQSKKMTLTK